MDSKFVSGTVLHEENTTSRVQIYAAAKDKVKTRRMSDDFFCIVNL